MPALLLVALFAAYYAGSSLFVHSHHTLQGLTTHSHPYLPDAAHGHSNAEFDALSLLNSIETDRVMTSVTCSAFLILITVFLIPESDRNAAGHSALLSVRGPPASR